MRLNAPIHATTADHLIDELRLTAHHRVVDLGCGDGQLLMRIIERTGASGLGVDIDGASLRRARAAARELPRTATADFREASLRQWQPGSGFDAWVCMGSTHGFADGEAAYSTCLSAFAEQARPGARLLVGEGFWQREPDPEYLALLGDPAGVYQDHAGNVQLGVNHGLTPVFAATSTEREWDEFEWHHRRRLEERAWAAPHDPTAQRGRDRSRAWRDAYLRWGRTTMGFGLYVFVHRV